MVLLIGLFHGGHRLSFSVERGFWAANSYPALLAIKCPAYKRRVNPHVFVFGCGSAGIEDVNRYGVCESTDDFLQKPFALQVLADKVRRLLDLRH